VPAKLGAHQRRLHLHTAQVRRMLLERKAMRLQAVQHALGAEGAARQLFKKLGELGPPPATS